MEGVTKTAEVKRGFGRSVRLKQIRRLAGFMILLNKSNAGSFMIRAARRWSVSRNILKLLLGYRWVFTTFSEAEATAARFIVSKHDHIDNAWTHLNFAKEARPSDYPALFYLTPVMSSSPNVFDLGGNVGNLFYCYARYLTFPSDLLWTVFDVPEMESIGRDVAHSRGETRLRFTTTLEDLSTTDILLASGSLHYFDVSLYELLQGVSSKPKHLIINRTPLTDAKSVVTVQDAGTYLCACKLYNKHDLMGRLQSLGYDLVDSWSVPELSIHIPCYPELSVPAYSGCYLRLK